jgi:hypothetical protein
MKPRVQTLVLSSVINSIKEEMDKHSNEFKHNTKRQLNDKRKRQFMKEEINKERNKNSENMEMKNSIS